MAENKQTTASKKAVSATKTPKTATPTKTTVAKKAPAAKTVAAPKAAAPKAAPKTTAVKTEAPKQPKTAAPKVTTKPVEQPSKPKVVAKKVNTTPKTLRVTLIKSTTGFNKHQAKIVEALGLNKLNSSNDLVDNAAVRGMIFKVKHLVRVEEIK